MHWFVDEVNVTSYIQTRRPNRSVRLTDDEEISLAVPEGWRNLGLWMETIRMFV